MNKIFFLYPIFLLALFGCGKTPAGSPVKLDKAAAQAVIREIEKDRADTREWLRSDPKSYLASIDRVDFGDRTSLTVGRAAENDIRLDAADIEPHHLKITVDGDRFRVIISSRVRARRELRPGSNEVT